MYFFTVVSTKIALSNLERDDQAWKEEDEDEVRCGLIL